MRRLSWIAVVFLLNGCTLAPLLGHIDLDGLDKTYEIPLSKEKLKDQIIETYSYDMPLVAKIFGRTLIEDRQVNSTYRRSITNWLDNRNWNVHRDEIRRSLPDTLNIQIVKHLSRKARYFQVIINGDEEKSTIRILKITAERFKEYSKPDEAYSDRIIKKIEKRFVDQIR